jgi:hypothetical protein
MLSAAPCLADEQRLALIKAVVTRDMCLDEHWANEILYRRDKPLTMGVIIDGSKYYSKVEDVYSFHGHSTTLYQIGILKPDRAIITHNFEMDMEERFAEGLVMTTTLTLPADCTPKYDPTTPEKELMIDTVVKTVQKHFDSLVKLGIAKYPRELTLVIADFNVDYPMTYVLAEPKNKVYRIYLHTQQDYDSGEYEQGGAYPLSEAYNPAKSLIKTIRKHGIKKKITLD